MLHAEQKIQQTLFSQSEAKAATRSMQRQVAQLESAQHKLHRQTTDMGHAVVQVKARRAQPLPWQQPQHMVSKVTFLTIWVCCC